MKQVKSEVFNQMESLGLIVHASTQEWCNEEGAYVSCGGNFKTTKGYVFVEDRVLEKFNRIMKARPELIKNKNKYVIVDKQTYNELKELKYFTSENNFFCDGTFFVYATAYKEYKKYVG